MKKQALFAVCLTAATAAVFTGCATKQEAAAKKTQMEATEISVAEAQQMEETVYEEPAPVVTPEAAAVPQEQTGPQVTPVDQPEQAAPKKEAPQSVRPAPVEYTVTAGDSVTALAVRFGVRKADILAMNPALRGNPNNLRVGQKLMFPAGTDVTKKAQRRETSAPPANAKRPAGTTVYTVKAGDVLGGIAIKHGVTVAEIKKANNLKKDMIWVGQKLTIPGATKKPAKAPAKVEKKQKPAEKKQPAPQAAPAEKPVEPIVEEVSAPQPEAAPTPVADEVLPLQEGEDAVLPPEPVVEAVSEKAAPQNEQVYVVKEGEDLLGIALRWGVTLTELRALNGLEEGAEPAPGQTLRLPISTNAQ